MKFKISYELQEIAFMLHGLLMFLGLIALLFGQS